MKRSHTVCVGGSINSSVVKNHPRLHRPENLIFLPDDKSYYRKVYEEC